MDTSPRRAEAESLDLLDELGFREYEAQCLVTLLETGEATAAEISEASEVPRSRVYDAAESLVDRGLAEVCAGEPRQFRAVPADAVVENIEDQFQSRISTLEEFLVRLEGQESCTGEECAVWQFNGESAIIARLRTLVENAEEVVVLKVTGDFLTEEYTDALAEAKDAGVHLCFFAASQDVRDGLRETFPESDTFDVPNSLGNMPGENDVVHMAFADWSSVLMVTGTQDAPFNAPEYVGTLNEGQAFGIVLTIGQIIRDELGNHDCVTPVPTTD